MRFIHLTGTERSVTGVVSSKLAIAIDTVSAFQETHEVTLDGTGIRTTDTYEYTVAEDYPTVLRLINNANNDTDEDHR